MPQVTVYIREEDIDAWKSVIKKSEFIHNALQDRSTYDGAKIVLREDLPPVKQEHKESPPLIRNLAEVVAELDEGEELYGVKQYDKTKPFWSPFGPLPVRQDPSMPMAVIDPNLDDEVRIPLDVDKRNAWLERE